MDWALYAEDLRNHSDSLIRNNRYLAPSASFDDSRRYDGPQRQEFLSVPQPGHEQPPANNNILDMNRNLAELRANEGHLRRKIAVLENLIRDYGQILDSGSESQLAVAARVEQVERDVYGSIQSSMQLNKERSELVLQSKQLASRLVSLESHVKELDMTCASKVSPRLKIIFCCVHLLLLRTHLQSF